MRNLFLVLVLVGLAACQDDVLPTKPVATPRKAKPSISAAVVAMPRVDTTRASSICKATLRAGGRAALKVGEEPSDPVARKKVVAYSALVTDACK